VSGGYFNTASFYSAVGGGFGNSASGYCSFIGGGSNNCVDTNFNPATIAGGFGNYISDIVPPSYMYLNCCGWNTIGGGSENQATTQWSTIARPLR
jgi:hypothetical protein